MSSEVQVSYLRKLENSEKVGGLITEMIDAITVLDRTAIIARRWWWLSVALVAIGGLIGMYLSDDGVRFLYSLWVVLGPTVVLAFFQIKTFFLAHEHRDVVKQCTELTTENPGEYRYMIDKIKSVTKDYVSGYKQGMWIGLFLFLPLLVALIRHF